MNDIILVVTTCKEKEEAMRLGTLLLEKRLVGCVQVSGPIVSQYHWQGSIEVAEEYRLEMKSVQGLWDKLEAEIQKNHSYDVPEIIATSVSYVGKNYKKWLLEELQQ